MHERISKPNLMVKIPATPEGVPAVQELIAEGRSINVTLLFGLERYEQIIDAYLAGLEACTGDLSRIHSVASFFLSRVDSEVDRHLDRIGSAEALELRGRAALAQANAAYHLFRLRFSGPRWEALAARGARVQRPLWASTSTKNPAYPDTMYVDQLIAPDTVTTLTEATIAAFEDHGTVESSIENHTVCLVPHSRTARRRRHQHARSRQQTRERRRRRVHPQLRPATRNPPAEGLDGPRVAWVMMPSGPPTNDTIATGAMSPWEPPRRWWKLPPRCAQVIEANSSLTARAHTHAGRAAGSPKHRRSRTSP